AVLLPQPVHALLVAGRAQRRGDQGLRLAAGEDGRAVRPRQHADLASNLAELLRVAAVDADAFQDQVADDALFQGAEGGRDLFRRVLRLAGFGDELGVNLVAEFADLVGAGVLAGRLLAPAQLLVKALAE